MGPENAPKGTGSLCVSVMEQTNTSLLLGKHRVQLPMGKQGLGCSRPLCAAGGAGGGVLLDEALRMGERVVEWMMELSRRRITNCHFLDCIKRW